MVAARRPNLVIVRAGDQSLHEGWLAGAQDRTWDLVVSYFGDDPDRYRVDDVVRLDCKGAKWPVLHQLVTVDLAEEIAGYDHVWFPDDDLETDAESIEKFFDICRRYALSLAQPALTEDSFHVHEVTLVDRRFGLRYTDFVEIMAPCFSREFLARCAPEFGATHTGWGLDFYWPTLAEHSREIAVVDAVTMRHTRKVGGPNVAEVRRGGIDPDMEFRNFMARKGLRWREATIQGVVPTDDLPRSPVAEQLAVCVTTAEFSPDFAVWLRFHARVADLVIVFAPTAVDRSWPTAQHPRVLILDAAVYGDVQTRRTVDIRSAIDIARSANMGWLLPLDDCELFYDVTRGGWRNTDAGEVTFARHQAVPLHPSVEDTAGRFASTLFRLEGRSDFSVLQRGRRAVRLTEQLKFDRSGFVGTSGHTRRAREPMVLRYSHPTFDGWVAAAREAVRQGGAAVVEFGEESAGLLQAVSAGGLDAARKHFYACLPSVDRIRGMRRDGELARINPIAVFLDSTTTLGDDQSAAAKSVRESSLPQGRGTPLATSATLVPDSRDPARANRLQVVFGKAPLHERPFGNFAVRKSSNIVHVDDFGGIETRNRSTMKILLAAVDKFRIGDFPWLVVHTGDHDAPSFANGHPTFSYSTTSGEYDRACPDFIFDHWAQTHIDDYEQTATELTAIGASRPATDLLGWRGAATNKARNALVALNDNVDFDVEMVSWDTSDPHRHTCSNFVSLADQVRCWRYLIDIEGYGYSGRLKLLFFSRRLVFLQQRPAAEWYFPDLKPWVHYVPVRRDLTDLPTTLRLVKENPELEQHIIVNALEFAQQRLTRAAALERWAELLSGLGASRIH